MRLRLGLLFLLFACDDRPRGDAGWYWSALTQAPSFEEAARACENIGAPISRDDCRFAAIEAWQRLDPDACETLDLPIWRDGCLFQVSARLGAAGDLDAALAVCAELRSPRWCTFQLLDGAVEASLDEPPAVAEARIESFVHVPSLSDAPLQFWTLRLRADAKRGHPIDPRVCDAVRQPVPCAMAVNMALRKHMDALSRRDAALGCAVARGEVSYPGTAPWVDCEPLRSFLGAWVSKRCDAAPAPPEPASG